MNWKEHGVKIVRAGELDSNTPQTPAMTRAAAITHARTGASKLWAGTMVVQPDAKTGPHHQEYEERDDGPDGSSSPMRPDPAISFMFPRMFRIRKSTHGAMSRAKRLSCEADRSRWW